MSTEFITEINRSRRVHVKHAVANRKIKLKIRIIHACRFLFSIMHTCTVARGGIFYIKDVTVSCASVGSNSRHAISHTCYINATCTTSRRACSRARRSSTSSWRSCSLGFVDSYSERPPPRALSLWRSGVPFAQECRVRCAAIVVKDQECLLLRSAECAARPS